MKSSTITLRHISLPDANKIYTEFATNIANTMYGAYLELGYDWFHLAGKKEGQFITFALWAYRFQCDTAI